MGVARPHLAASFVFASGLLTKPERRQTMNEQKVFRMNKKLFYVGVVAGLILVIFIIGIPILIANILRYKFMSITVTENGLLYKKGWLSTSQKQIPFSKINTVDLKMGLIGKAWDYGDVKVFTGNDVEGIVFKGIDRPRVLKQLIEARI